MNSSNPNFQYLQNLLFLLNRVVNPQLFFDVDPISEPERTIEKDRLEQEIENIIQGNAFRSNN